MGLAPGGLVVGQGTRHGQRIAQGARGREEEPCSLSGVQEEEGERPSAPPTGDSAHLLTEFENVGHVALLFLRGSTDMAA